MRVTGRKQCVFHEHEGISIGVRKRYFKNPRRTGFGRQPNKVLLLIVTRIETRIDVDDIADFVCNLDRS